MDNPKQQVIDRLQSANNVLVTVSNNPSVDQLAACIGVSLALNKLGKHATAVYSGETPSTIEFLQPEETLEKNTDSLRDFIISLDKSKADKLRYKVEENVVRIFITPYKTSISDKDLEFSQGDFNVDVVLAIGVHEQGELDQAITAHGRILHDATIVTVNNTDGADLGSVNWNDRSTSSLSEMATTLVSALGKDVLDEQISTALLTGIVAETNRFSNDKTSAETMKTSASLMSAGANQQLVASKLDKPEPKATPAPVESAQPSDQALPEDADAVVGEDGTLRIEHAETAPADQPSEPRQEQQPQEEQPAPAGDEDNHHEIISESYQNPRRMVTTVESVNAPPFTSAMSDDHDDETATSPINLPPVEEHTKAPDLEPIDRNKETLAQIEQDVQSPHLGQTPAPFQQPGLDLGPPSESASQPFSIPTPESPMQPEVDDQPTAGQGSATPDLDAARDAVAQAMAEAENTSERLEPIQALNAQPLSEKLHSDDEILVEPTEKPEHSAQDAPDPSEIPPITLPQAPPEPTVYTAPPSDQQAANQPMTMPLPSSPPAFPKPDTLPQTDSPNTPSSAPPVPPPILPPYQQ